jgi:hypothetical protein
LDAGSTHEHLMQGSILGAMVPLFANMVLSNSQIVQRIALQIVLPAIGCLLGPQPELQIFATQLTKTYEVLSGRGTSALCKRKR